MAVEKISIEKFLELAKEHPVLDVRSPGEYDHARIPGAYAFPLFSNEERKIVGTAYKQESREKAIKLGLEFFGKKMVAMVEEAEKMLNFKSQTSGSEIQNPKSKIVLVHCWRGGMRSAGVAWLLDLYGFKVYTLAGGYKAFRHWVLDQLQKEYSFNILGGFTGSGKTTILEQLKNHGEKVIDLEAIAVHKGSAFGAIGMPKQPSQEMFENLLAVELQIANTEQLSSKNIWLEDESQRIGLINLPQSFWKTMRSAPVFFIDIPFEERLDYLVKEYGQLSKEHLVNAVLRIKKRLGGLETKTAVNFLIEDDIKEAFRVLLTYYDKHYLKGLHNREGLNELLRKTTAAKVDAKTNAAAVIKMASSQARSSV